MKIGIRVDANEIIATGHVMRCLAIADALGERGEAPFFIAADDFPRDIIAQNGYAFHSLGSDWRYMDGELERLAQVIREQGIEILLVDSYYVTKSYLRQLRDLVKVVYIEDLGKEIYPVDVVICYANYYKDFLLKEKYPPQVKLFQGTKYVPLRSGFSNLPPKEISPKVRKLIVLSGGTDQNDFLWKFSKRIRECPLFEMLDVIHVICGKYYEKYDALIREFAGTTQFRFHRAVDNIEDYMLSSDVAISAAGVTSYELCAVGVPTIIVTTADNQQKNAESFYADGLMEYAGDLRHDPVLDRIIELLQGKYQDFAYRKKISGAMQKKVDGKGAQRIAEKIDLFHNQAERNAY